ncbi:MAG: DUF2812 domain-containing protein [Ruminococcus sp.]|nr:DUF2812 domain-containing protein [Ruminococcus sp.]
MKKLNDNVMELRVNFTYRDLAAIEEFLEAKQQEGWLLIEYDKNKMKFRKCEPSESRYCCEAYKAPNRPKYDEEYISFCEDAGWEFVASDWNGIYIFRTNDETLPKIMNDDKMKLSIMAKSFISKRIILLLAVGVWIIMKSITLFDNFRQLYNPFYFEEFLIVFLVVFDFFKDLLSLIVWCVKRKKEIKNNQPLMTNNLKTAEKCYVRDRVCYIIYAFLAMAAIIVSWEFYLIPIVVFLCVAGITIWHISKSDDISKKLKKKFSVFVAVIVAVFFGIAAVFAFAFPKGEEDTKLTDTVSSKFSVYYDETKSTWLRYYHEYYFYEDYKDPEVYYYEDDRFPEIKVHIMKLPFMRQLYLKYITDIYGEMSCIVDEENGFKVYVAYIDEEPTHCLAVCGEYVIEMNDYTEDTAKLLKEVLLSQKQTEE